MSLDSKKNASKIASRITGAIIAIRARPRMGIFFAVIAAAALSYWLLPLKNIVSALIETPAAEFDRLRDVLRLVIQLGIGIMILVGISILRRRFRVQDIGARFDRENRLSERFLRAVEQLGGTETQIRLGGIYALDGITRDSPEEAHPIAGILSAFIRERGRAASESREPGADIQTALTLLTSRRAYAGIVLDLRGTMLENTDLDSALLEKARLDGARLAGARLGNARLRHASLPGSDLQGADLRRADLRETKLDGANMRETQLTNARLEDSRLNDSEMTNAHLGGAGLRACNLSRSILTDAVLTNADLKGANLSGAVLIRGDLAGAVLDECNLTGTDATEAGMSGTRLRGAFLFEADFSGAHAGGANFTNANLTGANFRRTNLTGADLQNANLAGANLQQAHLFEANLLHADLTAANLREVIGLTLKQLFEARTLYRAVLDEELRLQVEKEYPELLREPPAPAGGDQITPEFRVQH